MPLPTSDVQEWPTGLILVDDIHAKFFFFFFQIYNKMYALSKKKKLFLLL